MSSDKESGNSSSARVQVYLAIIALIGTIATAVFANWDKIFPPKPTTSGNTTTLPSPSPSAPATLIASLDISGKWEVPDFSEEPMTLVQTGNKVRGKYPYRNGTVFLGQLDTNQLEAYWVQSTSKITCGISKNGSYHWGKLKLEFTDSLYASGTWCYCEDETTKTPFEANKIE